MAEYNTMVETVAASFQAAGKRISVTDNHSNFPAGGLADGTHPNDTGYQWLAKQWFTALFSAFSSGGTSLALSQSSSVTVEANATLDLNDNTATTGSVAILSGSNLTARPTATLVSSGSVTLAGNLVFTAPSGLAPGASFTILKKTGSGAITGTFAEKAEGSTFTAGGQNWQITYLGGDGNDVVVTIVQPMTAAEIWRQIHFGTTENTGNAADSSDLNNDSETNLIEFATGQNPHAATRATTTLALPPGTDLDFTYTRNKAALDEGYTFTVEYSDTLAPNTWTPAPDPGTVLLDGPTQTVKVTLPEGTAGHRFIRLKVSAP